jgi:acetoin utilization deacetylase AcuC-like enzyme
VDQFSLAHDRAFVEGVLSGGINNGFGNTLPSVAASLPYTSGVMLSAARAALTNQRGAIAPCSGFHHAGYDTDGGFCTFNGLMVTAAVLLAESKVHKIGILDCDQHWGNGTQDIIDRLHVFVTGWCITPPAVPLAEHNGPRPFWRCCRNCSRRLQTVIWCSIRPAPIPISMIRWAAG